VRYSDLSFLGPSGASERAATKQVRSIFDPSESTSRTVGVASFLPDQHGYVKQIRFQYVLHP